MAILGIDYGEKRTGIAMSDETKTFAHQYYPITGYKSEEELIEKIVELVNSNNIDMIIIGIPYGIDRKETKISLKIKAFIVKLKEKINLDVIEWDETGTSRFAVSNLGVLAKRRSVDSESARVMLQEYIDHEKLK